MQKNTFIGIAIVVLLAIAGVWFSVPSVENKEVTVPENTPTTTPVAAIPTPLPPLPKKPVPKPATGSGNTYKSLLTQQGSYQCDYSQVSSAGQSQNVIYISNGKLRAEFRTMSGDTSSSNLSVYDGQYLYEWREGTAVGTKKLLTSLSELPAAIPKDLTSGGVIGNNGNSVGWNCHVWLVDAKILVPPSYVKFN